jgi:hypothetical protein
MITDSEKAMIASMSKCATQMVGLLALLVEDNTPEQEMALVHAIAKTSNTVNDGGIALAQAREGTPILIIAP